VISWKIIAKLINMKKGTLFLICLVSVLLLTSCGTTYYVPNRPYGYKPDFSRTYSDKSVYRPSHYRNFMKKNSVYLNDQSRRTAQNTNIGSKNSSGGGRSDEVYLVKSYLDTHSDTGEAVYHTTYTTSYNENGEVTTTYTTDYVGSKKEKQYWQEVKKEQKKAYKESRKRSKMKVRDDDD
jgi:hypothetical protein